MNTEQLLQDGPYDISECGPDVLHDQLIDLGALAFEAGNASSIRINNDDNTATIVFNKSAIELAAFAAPRSGGLWHEMREEIKRECTAANGTWNERSSPFGVELRLITPVSSPDGVATMLLPKQVWAVEKQRWLLKATVLGRAALANTSDQMSYSEDKNELAAAIQLFRTIIVRRGRDARFPGDPLQLSVR